MGNGSTQPPREAWQTEEIREIKTNTDRLVNIISSNAGKSPKNAIDVRSAEDLADRINKSMKRMAGSHRFTPGNLNRWAEFWNGWREGSGSWTDGKKRILEFQGSMKDLEP